MSNIPVQIPKSGLLRWELSLALVVKVLLLLGLWFLIFRWSGRPVDKPDIAAHFMQQSTPLPAQPEALFQSQQELNHVR